jgi:SAM-dependent methyltransferase
VPLSGRVLDLGTGTGTLARGYRERGARTIALDLSLPMLRAAQDAGPRVASRAESLPFADGAFDAVTAGQCWHWFDAAAAAAECWRVLRPGGTLIIAHFDYLADRPGIAAATDELILRFNPSWTMAGGDGLHEQYRSELQAYEGVRSFSYDEPVEYSREGWRGRMRACNGALAIRDEAARERLDRAIDEMLTAFDGPLVIPHRVFVISGAKPG